jgi:hypothetical protein
MQFCLVINKQTIMKKDVKTILLLIVFTLGVLSAGTIKSKINQKMDQFSGIVSGQTTITVPVK